jgi:hypothetical protein
MIYKLQAWDKEKLVLQRDYDWTDQEFDLAMDCLQDFIESAEKYKDTQHETAFETTSEVAEEYKDAQNEKIFETASEVAEEIKTGEDEL